MLTHCHCKTYEVHVRVSDLYDYHMLYHSILTKGQYANSDSIKSFIKILRRSRLMNLQILVRAHGFQPAFLYCFEI